MSRESRESVSTRASTPAFSRDGMSDVGTHTETMTIGSFSDSEAPPPEDSPTTAFAREVFVGQVLEAIEEQEEAARLYALAPAPSAIACAPAPALAAGLSSGDLILPVGGLTLLLTGVVAGSLGYTTIGDGPANPKNRG